MTFTKMRLPTGVMSPRIRFHGGEMMRYFLMACLLACVALTASGCIVPGYSGDPQVRIKQELYDSENMRQAEQEWTRLMMNDKPSSLTLDRLNGSIM